MLDLFEKLGINWKLLLAQSVNFLLVLFLLNRFVFKKLIAFLGGRKQRIAQGVEMREKAERELQRTMEARHRELEQARKEAELLVSGAKVQAQQSGAKILAEAKNREENILLSAKERLEREKTSMVAEAKEEIGARAVLFAEKILQRSLKKSDEERMIQEVMKEL